MKTLTSLLLLANIVSFAFAPLCSAQMAPKFVITRDVHPDSLDKALTKMGDEFEKRYVYADKGALLKRTIDANRAKYKAIKDPMRITESLQADLLAVVPDKHIQIRLKDAVQMGSMKLVVIPSPPTSGGVAQAPQHVTPQHAPQVGTAPMPPERSNGGISKVEILPGNIGYMEITSFESSIEVSGRVIMGAMNYLANTDAIIFDVRKNLGGSSEIPNLLTGYFLEKPTLIQTMYDRGAGVEFEDWTTTLTESFKQTSFNPIQRQLETSTTDFERKKWLNKDVYVLTSKETFSAGEHFAYSLQAFKRAKVVGETSGGGGHLVMPIVIDETFAIYVPFARLENAITKSNWEGVGVQPDIATSASKALEMAHREVLNKKIAHAGNDQEKRQLLWDADNALLQYTPTILTETGLKKFVGKYDDRTITLENGILYSNRAGRVFPLKPMSDTTFYVTDTMRLRFVADSKGSITSVEAIFSDRPPIVVKKNL